MEEGRHEHYYFFNSDGFEVCIECGICTSDHEMVFQTIKTEHIVKYVTPFSNILINNNIGYFEEIDNNFKCLKSFLKRGYQNIVLYAFCTYNTLLKNHVYYSLQQISVMFNLPHFKKQYCQIKKNPKLRDCLFHIKDEHFIKSAASLFLAELGQSDKLTKTVQLAKSIDKICPSHQQNILIACSLFLTLCPAHPSQKQLLVVLSNHFSANLRTLRKTVLALRKNDKVLL